MKILIFINNPCLFNNIMTYFNINPKPQNFIHPNDVSRIDKVSYGINSELESIFCKLCSDEAIDLVQKKGGHDVIFK